MRKKSTANNQPFSQETMICRHVVRHALPLQFWQHHQAYFLLEPTAGDKNMYGILPNLKIRFHTKGKDKEPVKKDTVALLFGKRVAMRLMLNVEKTTSVNNWSEGVNNHCQHWSTCFNQGT